MVTHPTCFQLRPQLALAGVLAFSCRIASPQLLLNSVVASPDLLLAKPV